MGGAYMRTVALTGADQAVMDGAAIYRGITVLNSHATEAAAVRVYDSADAAAGTLLDVVGLAAGASLSLVYDGIWASEGVVVSVAGGTVEGSVRIG